MKDKDIEKLANDFGKHTKKEYHKNRDAKTKYINDNVVRKVNLTMASACEDEVALLVSKILKIKDNEKLSILVDVYLSYDNEQKKRKPYRPDILIVKTTENNNKKQNEIIGIIEVKAQMGYCGALAPDDFLSKLDDLNGGITFTEEDWNCLTKAEKKFYGRFGITNFKETAEFTVNDNCKIYVVSVLTRLSFKYLVDTIKKFDDKNYDRVKFYSLFAKNNGSKKIWYDLLNFKNIFDKVDNNPMKNIIIEDKYKEEHGFYKFVNDIKDIENI